MPMLAIALVIACGDASSASGDDGGSTAASGGTEPTTDGDTGVPPPDDPYGACGDPDAPVDCDAHPTAICDGRDDPTTMVPYVVCAAACESDADCPVLGAGNIAPSCAGPAGMAACRIVCNLEANSCPSAMVCVDGDPPQCMWSAHDAPTHASIPEFCATVCDDCGATLLLPWTTDCAAACEADLADCDDAARDEAFACTGGVGCPAGGAVVADCLAPLACVQGS